jgi:uncharacterized membrane protein YfcA
MAVAPRPGIWTTKPAEALVADTEERTSQLRRAVGALDLTALGLGAIIGPPSRRRRRSPRFRVPLVPLAPLIGAALCIFLMKYLSGATWIRFGIWLLAGLAIYFVYGRTHSRLRRGEASNPEAELAG